MKQTRPLPDLRQIVTRLQGLRATREDVIRSAAQVVLRSGPAAVESQLTDVAAKWDSGFGMAGEDLLDLIGILDAAVNDARRLVEHLAKDVPLFSPEGLADEYPSLFEALGKPAIESGDPLSQEDLFLWRFKQEANLNGYPVAIIMFNREEDGGISLATGTSNHITDVKREEFQYGAGVLIGRTAAPDAYVEEMVSRVREGVVAGAEAGP